MSNTSEIKSALSLKISIAIVGLVFTSSLVVGGLNWFWAGQSEALAAGRNQILWQTLFAALFFSGAGFMASRTFAAPIQSLVDAFANGDRAKAQALTQRDDEIGHLANAFLALQADSNKSAEAQADRDQIIQALQTGLDHLKRGELNHRPRSDLPAAYAVLNITYTTKQRP